MAASTGVCERGPRPNRRRRPIKERYLDDFSDLVPRKIKALKRFGHLPRDMSFSGGNVKDYEEARLSGEGLEFSRNRLTLLETVGSGSFATVRRAQAVGLCGKETETIVAAKILKSLATDNHKRDFMKELNLMKTLDQHPNVTRLLGCCTDQEPWLLLLEYLPNGNLHSHLRCLARKNLSSISEDRDPSLSSSAESTDVLDSRQLLMFAVQIARGMEYLANKKCVHRDLATRNILLGDDMVCKISDFGLARDIENEHTYEMKSRTPLPFRWMAPESLLFNTYTSQSDVWSFGVLIWEIVTLGAHPYSGMSSHTLVKEIQNGYRLTSPDHCSQEIKDIMARCWQCEPHERPTFTTVRETLEYLLADSMGYLEITEFHEENYSYLRDSHQSDTTDVASSKDIEVHAGIQPEDREECSSERIPPL